MLSVSEISVLISVVSDKTVSPVVSVLFVLSSVSDVISVDSVVSPYFSAYYPATSIFIVPLSSSVCSI